MPNLIPVRKSEHLRYSWRPYTDYRFTAADSSVPIVMQEFAKLATIAPIVFVKRGAEYQPVLLLGIEADKNTFVSESGTWLLDYIPAQYRSYPFGLGSNGEGQRFLCFHGDSALVASRLSTDPAWTPFFDGDELSAPLGAIQQFLAALERNRLKTQALMALYDSLDLLKAADLVVERSEVPTRIEGFFQIDPDVLKGLSGKNLKKLASGEALQLAYAHLLSLNNVGRLLSLHDRKLAERKATDYFPGETSTSIEHEDSINIDFLNL